MMKFFIYLFFPLVLFSQIIYLSNQKNKVISFEKNITITGNLNINDLKNNFNIIKIKNSSNIFLKDINIKYKVFPNLRIKVVKISHNKIYYKLLDKKEYKNYLAIKQNEKFLKKMYLVDSNLSIKFAKVKSLKDNFLKVSKKASLKIKANQIYFLVARFKKSLFIFKNCENIHIDNVFLNSSSNMVFLFLNSKNIYINNVKIEDISKRGITSNADIIHCGNCEGNIFIKNSYFENVSDDIINITFKPVNLNKIEKNKINFSVFNSKKGLLLKSINKNMKNCEIYPLYFQNIKIANNVFKSSRRYGIFIKNKGEVKIFNNYFFNLNGEAITFHNTPATKEGLFGENIYIFKNNIINCGNKSLAAVSVYCLKSNRKFCNNEKLYFKNINIYDNKMKNLRYNFFLKNISGLYLYQ
jgi:hypothetical protein